MNLVLSAHFSAEETETERCYITYALNPADLSSDLVPC